MDATTDMLDLKERLFVLSKIVIEKTLMYRDSVKLTAIPRQRIPVKEINYVSNSFRYDWDRAKNFNIYEYTTEQFWNLLRNEIFTLDEYDDVVKAMMEKFSLSEEIIKDLGLFSYLRFLIKHVPNETITIENIRLYIDLFLTEYTRGENPIQWHVELWLENITIESDEIELVSNVFLKKPTKNQLEYIGPPIHFVDELSRMGSKVMSSSVILTFSINATKDSPLGLYPEEVTKEIEIWLNILRLFKVGSISTIYRSVKPHSLYYSSSSEEINSPGDKVWKGKIEHKDTSNYVYHIPDIELDMLKQFNKRLLPILRNVSHTAYLTGNNVDLALHRYTDALLKSEVNVYKIQSAITSLEALLGGTSEITYKMRLRIAGLLRFYSFNSIHVFDEISSAYTVRSGLVHGNKLDKLLKFANENAHNIVNYSRVCLLIALQLKAQENRDSFIKKIDHSFIDENAHLSLQTLLSNSVYIPITNQFKRD